MTTSHDAGKTMEATEAEQWAALMQKDYHHPFTPYHVQREFMSRVYKCLEDGKVGIFESPTGTGKSLSLICGSLTWLKDWKRKAFEQALHEGEEEVGDEPDWMVASAREQKKKLLLQDRADREARLARVRDKEERARRRYENREPPQKRQRTDEPSRPEADDEAEFLLDDYHSDDEGTTKRSAQANGQALSIDTQALLAKLGEGPSRRTEDDAGIVEDELKIFYCSRTHSQISQFVNELRRVKLPPSVPPDLATNAAEQDPKSTRTTDQEQMEELKHLTLGSRKNLCINATVAKPGASATSITERCLELQQPSTPKDKKCRYMPSKENEVLVNDFRDHALAKIRDIEDFGKLGKKIGVCPYYATRAAIKPAEIVTLPYPLLLQKSAREALEISLKGHIVIIDEAHNLMDAIANIHSVSITQSQLQLARAQLGGYLLKFKNRLKGKNRVYVTQLVRVIDSLAAYLAGRGGAAGEGAVQVGELMAGKGVDQINLYKLMHYLQESKLARKVERYAVYAEEQQAKSSSSTTFNASTSKKADHRTTPGERKAGAPAGMPVLIHLQGFLLALTHPATEGRFFYDATSAQDVVLKYLLLDPTHHFREIVDEARAVILAGGTMSPITDYTTHLLPYLPPSRLLTLSCSHVIPASNLLAMPISLGPSGIPFDFTFAQRNSEDMVRELGGMLVELSEVVPDGLVVFFPSYAYLDGVLAVWKRARKEEKGGSSGGEGGESIWERLEGRKKVFVEPRSTAASSTSTTTTSSTTTPADSSSSSINNNRVNTIPATLDALLTAYSAHIHSFPVPSTSTSTSTTTSASTTPSANKNNNNNNNTSNNNTGAILLAVINGSLSEGINFSDRLGRCVVVVGLPFPNANSADWKAKLDFIGRAAAGEAQAMSHASKPAETVSAVGATAGAQAEAKGMEARRKEAEAAKRTFYTNTAMRAVNQSVGRAIRHRGDWATILLVDGRWELREELRGKLPGWIGRSLEGVGGAGAGGGGIGKGESWRRTRRRLEVFYEEKRG